MPGSCRPSPGACSEALRAKPRLPQDPDSMAPAHEKVQVPSGSTAGCPAVASASGPALDKAACPAGGNWFSPVDKGGALGQVLSVRCGPRGPDRLRESSAGWGEELPGRGALHVDS
jgi:hypothetical protein